MTQQKRVRAIYYEGVLQLLEPVDLPEGAEIQITVPAGTAMQTPSPGLRYPSRPTSPDALSQLCGLIALGGDALLDSEASNVPCSD